MCEWEGGREGRIKIRCELKKVWQSCSSSSKRTNAFSQEIKVTKTHIRAYSVCVYPSVSGLERHQGHLQSKEPTSFRPFPPH